MAKFFKKSRKKLGDQFGPFLLKFGQKYIFAEKRALPVFKYSNYFFRNIEIFKP